MLLDILFFCVIFLCYFFATQQTYPSFWKSHSISQHLSMFKYGLRDKETGTCTTQHHTAASSPRRSEHYTHLPIGDTEQTAGDQAERPFGPGAQGSLTNNTSLSLLVPSTHSNHNRHRNRSRNRYCYHSHYYRYRIVVIVIAVVGDTVAIGVFRCLAI